MGGNSSRDVGDFFSEGILQEERIEKTRAFRDVLSQAKSVSRELKDMQDSVSELIENTEDEPEKSVTPTNKDYATVHHTAYMSHPVNPFLDKALRLYNDSVQDLLREMKNE